MTVVDGHVMLGHGRDASLTAEELLATMERLGIERALVSPAEGYLPVRNREGTSSSRELPPRRAGGCSPTRSRRRGLVPRRSRS